MTIRENVTSAIEKSGDLAHQAILLNLGAQAFVYSKVKGQVEIQIEKINTFVNELVAHGEKLENKTKEQFDSKAPQFLKDAVQAADDAAEKVEDFVEDAIEDAAEEVKSIRKKTKAKAKKVAKAVTEKAEDIKEDVEELVEDIAEKISDAVKA